MGKTHEKKTTKRSKTPVRETEEAVSETDNEVEDAEPQKRCKVIQTRSKVMVTNQQKPRKQQTQSNKNLGKSPKLDKVHKEIVSTETEIQTAIIDDNKNAVVDEDLDYLDDGIKINIDA